MRFMILLFIFIFSEQIFSDEIYRIHTSSSYSAYTVDELKKRVWELERAVWQLQQKVFEIEKREGKQKSWVCKIKGMGDLFTSANVERALAEKDALEKCLEAGTVKKGFTCSEAVCSQ